MGHARRPPRRDLGGLQVRAQADARPAAGAVPVLPPDRRGLRLPQPRVRGLGGGRRHRHPRDPGRRGRDQDDRRLHGSRRLPARLRQRDADDDPARGLGRPRLHAGAGGGALRDQARADSRLHRPQGRHLRQHPGDPRDRRQDRRPADRAVRLRRGRHRARRRPHTCAAQERDRERGPGQAVEGAGDHAPRPRARLRRHAARPRAARSLGAEGDVQALRVPQPPGPGRRARCRSPGRADEARHDDDSLARRTK